VTATPSLPLELHADRFHAGVRLTALGVWALCILLFYFVAEWLWTAVLGAGSWLVFLVIAVFLSQPIIYFSEKRILRWWPSGRAARLEAGQLIWRDKKQTLNFNLTPHHKVNYWRWRFTVRRNRGRVRDGYQCCALRLVQGEQACALYTFLPPERAKELGERYAFHSLQPPAPGQKPALNGGLEAILLTAEEERWSTGAELDPDDFEILLAHLASYLPAFHQQTTS